MTLEKTQWVPENQREPIERGKHRPRVMRPFRVLPADISAAMESGKHLCHRISHSVRPPSLLSFALHCFLFPCSPIFAFRYFKFRANCGSELGKPGLQLICGRNDSRIDVSDQFPSELGIFEPFENCDILDKASCFLRFCMLL